MSNVNALNEKYDLGDKTVQRPCKCAVASPLTMFIGGSTVAVPAQAMAGSTFSVGQTGTALLQDGQPPRCFKAT